MNGVRYAAAGTLGELAKVNPSHAPEALEALLKAVGDEDEEDGWQVQEAAASALGELVKAAPSLAPEALPALVKAARDDYFNTRSAAAHAPGELVKAASSHAPEALYKTALEALVKAAVESSHPDVRGAAANALEEIEKIMEPCSVVSEEKK